MSVSPTSNPGVAAQAARTAQAAATQLATAKRDEDAAIGDPDHDGAGPEPAAQPTAAKGTPAASAVTVLNAADNNNSSNVSAAAATAAYQRAS